MSPADTPAGADEIDAFPAGSMVAFDLAVSLWMIGRGQDVAQTLGLQILATVLRDQSWPMVGHRSGSLSRGRLSYPCSLASHLDDVAEVSRYAHGTTLDRFS